MNRLRASGLSTLLSFALASLVLQSPALAQSSSWQMQQMRQQQQMQQQQAMQRQQQMQQQQAMQRQQQQMQQQQAMQRQQQMQQQQASQRQQQQYQQRQQQQTMQSQHQQQQALIQRQQQSVGSQRQTYQQRLGVQQQNQQRTYAPAQASAAIKGAANRNVTAREGRGFVSSGGVAKLTRPMTPGDIKKGFTGRVTADGRALVKFQGRVFAVPAAVISGLVKKPSAQSQMVANTNRWNAQQKVAMSARLRALTAQNTVVANNRLNAQQSLATNARLRALSAQKVAAAAGNGGGRLPPSNYASPANQNSQSANRIAFTNFFKNKRGQDVAMFSHAKGIDFSKPVNERVLQKGETVCQFQSAGRGAGDYFAPCGQTPSQLGIHSQSISSTGAVEDRVLKRFVVDREVKVLESTAAGIEDNFSVAGERHPTKGGGRQYFTNDKDAFVEIK